MAVLSDYAQARSALSGERLPAVFVDLDAFDGNLERHAAVVRARSKRLRLASKSVRVVALLRRLLERGRPAFQGLMCFAAREVEFLADRGFDDFLLAYPVWQDSDLEALARLVLSGKTVRIVADSPEGVDRVAELARRRSTVFDLVLCVDMSLRAARGRVHLGVRRSPLHDPTDVVALARHARSVRGVQVVGVLGYEAQVAGLGDRNPFEPWMNPVKKAIRRVSVHEVHERRRKIVEALRSDGFSIELVNGGGTGSLTTTTEESDVTEATAGSGFFKPHLFDYYDDPFVRSLAPSCFFALEVTRRPTANMVTCLGGGYIASGKPGPDKVPLPWLPRGLALLPQEMCGEVQTPLAVPRDVEMAMGDPVVFRHAKAGELMERFEEVLLVADGRLVDRVPTYRGESQCFF